MGIPFIDNAELIADMVNKFKNEETMVITSANKVDRLVGGPLFNNLALEYLFGATTMYLSTICQVYGPPKARKSTIVLALLKKLFIDNGASAALIDTEAKISAPLVRDLMQGYDLPIFRSTLQSDVQRVIMRYIEQVRSRTKGPKADRSRPMMLALSQDSFKTVSEETLEAIKKSGNAESRAFSTEANSWSRFIPTAAQFILEMPFVWFVVNHAREEKINMFASSWDSPGGQALKYYQTYMVFVQALKTQRNKTACFTDVKLYMNEASNVETKRMAVVRVNYQTDRIVTPDDEEQGFNEIGTFVDWDYAELELLTSTRIPRSRLSSQGICNASWNSAGTAINDTVIGVKGMEPSEYLNLLKSDESRLEAFRDALNITRGKTLDELWDAGWFFDRKDSDIEGHTPETRKTRKTRAEKAVVEKEDANTEI